MTKTKTTEKAKRTKAIANMPPPYVAPSASERWRALTPEVRGSVVLFLAAERQRRRPDSASSDDRRTTYGSGFYMLPGDAGSRLQQEDQEATALDIAIRVLGSAAETPAPLAPKGKAKR